MFRIVLPGGEVKCSAHCVEQFGAIVVLPRRISNGVVTPAFFRARLGEPGYYLVLFVG